MDTPIKSQGYYKYCIQTGWFSPDPNNSSFLISVMAQDILSKSQKDAVYLMKFLYPNSLNIEFPYLCPIIAEIKTQEEESDIFGNPIELIDLVYPN